MTFTRALSTNNYGPSKFIVDGTTVANATHSTIAAALSSASAGDTIFIRSGTYTENLTLKNGVQLAAYDFGGGSGGRTRITGKMIDNGSVVNATITNIDLHTNNDNIVALTGSGSTVVLSGCTVNCTNNTGFSLAAGTNVYTMRCLGDLGTTGIAFNNSAGTWQDFQSWFTNSGGSTTASTTSGQMIFQGTYLNTPLLTSGSGMIVLRAGCVIDAGNSTAVTTAGTGTSSVHLSQLISGTASAISVGSGTTVNAYDSTINSSNTNAITGAGTIVYGALTFTGSSSTINTTSKTPIAWPVLQGGTGLTATTANQILYSSAANTIAGLATANSGVLTTSSSGVPSIDTTNFAVLTTGVQMKGNNANTAPPAGFIGEQISSVVSGVAMVSATNKNVTSIVITAGVWSVTGIINYSNASGTGNTLQSSVSLVSVTHGTLGDNSVQHSNVAGTQGSSGVIPSYRITVAGSTTVYLVGLITIATGSIACDGRLSAVRVG